MFRILQAEIIDRCSTAERFLDSACRPGSAQLASTVKGLVFVQLYAVYEYTVTGSVQAGLEAIKQQALPVQLIRMELLPLILYSETNAVIDSGAANTWKKRIELFQMVDSVKAFSGSTSAFPTNGSHFRLPQLEVIWDLFGITLPVLPDVRLTPLIGELVENRNAIAHGRFTPNEVGRRYPKAEVASKVDATRRICIYLLETLRTHVSVLASICR